MMVSSLFLAGAALLPLPLIHAQSVIELAYAVPPVHLSNGLTIHGQRSSNASNVAEYLGIPYAQPPLGARRFAPPELYVPPSNDSLVVIKATSMPPSCYQFISTAPSMLQHAVYGWMIGDAGMSEDCLTASVWAPADAVGRNSTGGELLPVMIYFYGGGFATGGTDVPYQIPAQWVGRSEKHIVVTFNYRLNLFGFPNAAGLSSQNLGLMDQRLAVEWIAANVAAFGGDPDRMAIWGHSAGSVAVDYYNFAYPSDPIVKGLIMDSGTAHLDQLLSPDMTHSNFSFVASQVGCANMINAEAELACMRTVPAATLETFIAGYEDNGTSPSIDFAPIVDNTLVWANYTERALAGNMSTLPAIIGFNANEGAFLATYNESGPDEATATALGYEFFYCPTTKTTYERLAMNRTTHRYYYTGNFSNISPLSWMGAYHSSELPLLFGTHANLRGNSTELEYEVSRTMQDAYLAFVTDPETGLEAVGWPAYNRTTGGLARTYAENGTVSRVRSLGEFERECGSLGQL